MTTKGLDRFAQTFFALSPAHSSPTISAVRPRPLTAAGRAGRLLIWFRGLSLTFWGRESLSIDQKTRFERKVLCIIKNLERDTPSPSLKSDSKLRPRHPATLFIARDGTGEIMTAAPPPSTTTTSKRLSVINIQIDEGREGARAVQWATAAFKSPKHDGAR